jgi:hypothetical protein
MKKRATMNWCFEATQLRKQIAQTMRRQRGGKAKKGFAWCKASGGAGFEKD